MLETIEPFWTPSFGLTASAVIAVVIFILKISVDVWNEWQRRKHLRSALRAYIEFTNQDLVDVQKRTDFHELERKIREDKGFTPYGVYSTAEVLSPRDVILNYGFLGSKVMKEVIEQMTTLDYLYSFYKEFRTEYVRGFSPERKIKMLGELKRALKDAVKQSEKAHKSIKQLK